MNLKRFLLLLALALLQACATGPDADPKDPLEPLNRAVFRFNEVIDEGVLKPVASVYEEALPSPVRTGVNNFFSNLSDIWSFVNTLFQCKPKEAAENLMRVGVNTFFGLGGLLDVASDLNIEKHKEDFGQTLGYWGVGSGPYLVLPFFGPSTLRDSVGLAADVQGDVVRHIHPVDERNSLYVLRTIDTRADLLALGNILDEAALEKYSFTRDAYLQRRRSLIRDGQDEPEEKVPAPAPSERADIQEQKQEEIADPMMLALTKIFAD